MTFGLIVDNYIKSAAYQNVARNSKPSSQQHNSVIATHLIFLWELLLKKWKLMKIKPRQATYLLSIKNDHHIFGNQWPGNREVAITTSLSPCLFIQGQHQCLGDVSNRLFSVHSRTQMKLRVWTEEKIKYRKVQGSACQFLFLLGKIKAI